MKILFLCTHNACRSVLSEAILRDRAKGLIEVASAGSEPSGNVHPQTLRQLQERGYSIDSLHSKGFDDLAAFKPDAVVTVCDRAAQESCPVWLDSAIKVHWGLPDPTRESSAQKMDELFGKVILTIEQRTRQLLAEYEVNTSKEAFAKLLQRIRDDHNAAV
ncbi:arsenate reductase ArsC [Congregibacter variabilis]|uniref:Arsenate reductase ArsC n=1 Tax=Congregibacter variabilis TaxID=3081200 RepID=A0ABZ0I0N6_9GAMM|nr:arsenate reductase ArsC [Congregibacter sp. IMCC43200]